MKNFHTCPNLSSKKVILLKRGFMKKIVTLLLLLLCTCTFAQLNVNIDADYYIGKTNTFLVKKDGGYTTHYLWVEFDKQQNRFITRFSEGKPESLDHIQKQHRATKDELIPFTSLRKSNAADVVQALEKVEFTYPKEGDAKKSWYYTINFSDNYALQRFYIHDAMQPESTAHQLSFFDIVPVTINNNYTLLYFFRNNYIQGYVAPIKNDDYYLRLISNNTTPKMGIAKSDLRQDMRLQYPDGELFSTGYKFGLRQKNGGRVFIPAVYDSVKVHYGSFITAYQGNTPKLFYRNGDAVTLPGLRAVHIDPTRRMNVLVGNAISYIDTDGKLVETLKPADMWGCGTVPHITESIIKKDGNYIFNYLYQYGDRREMEYTLATASKYKSLTFLNGALQRSYRNYGSPEYKLPQHCFIAETIEGKGIVQIDYNKPNPEPKVVLPFGNYTFTFKDFSYPVKFTKDGLCGFFPQNKITRYSELNDFVKGFARFKLPNEKMGWLSFEGVEYLDE